MKRNAYRQLHHLNHAFREVIDSLQVLRKQPAFVDDEIRKLQALAAEARASINSYLLEALGAKETAECGWLFRKRLIRERKEEQK